MLLPLNAINSISGILYKMTQVTWVRITSTVLSTSKFFDLPLILRLQNTLSKAWSTLSILYLGYHMCTWCIPYWICACKAECFPPKKYKTFLLIQDENIFQRMYGLQYTWGSQSPISYGLLINTESRSTVKEESENVRVYCTTSSRKLEC